jgi:hypothetical protein
MFFEWLSVFCFIFLEPFAIYTYIVIRLVQKYERNKYEKDVKEKKSFMKSNNKKKDNVLTSIKF